jgi:glycosyltransferase involved in cell wall biosynthesis/ADP-heptose:LPS heptosyltransferase
VRILVLTNIYPPHFIGGYELGCQRMVEALALAGHEVTVLTSTYGVSGAQVTGRVHRLLTMDSTRQVSLARVIAKETANQAHFRRLCVVQQPDLVFCWNLAGISVSLASLAADLSIPVSYYVFDNWLATLEVDQWFRHCLQLPPLARVVLRMARPSLRFLAPGEPGGLDRAIFSSRYLKRMALAAGKEVAAAPVLHWGVVPEPSEPAQVSAALRIIYVGQIVRLKGVHTVVEAVGILERRYGFPVSLTLVGDAGFCSEYTGELQEIAARYRITSRLHFVGKVPAAEIGPHLRSHGILVFSSTWDEPFGITQLEAMSHGLAVVGTATGGSAEILRDGDNSLVFQREDAEGCARQIARLLADPELFRRLCLGGLRSVREDFNFQLVAREMERLLVAATGAGTPSVATVSAVPLACAVTGQRGLLPQAAVLLHKVLSVVMLGAFVHGYRLVRHLREALARPAAPGADEALLLVALGSAVDLALAEPFFARVRSQSPHAKIVFVVRSSCTSLLEGHPHLDVVLPFDFETVSGWQRMTRGHLRWWRSAFALSRELAVAFDTGVTLGWRNPAEQAASAAVLHAAGARRLLGIRYDGSGVVHQLLGHYIAEGPIRSQLGGGTDACAMGRLADYLGERSTPDDAGAEGGETRSAGTPKIAALLPAATGPVVALAPGCDSSLGQWPLADFAALGRWLREEFDASLVILGTKGDGARCWELQELIGKTDTIVVAGELALHELLDLLPAITLCCGNENASFYAAVQLGTPALGLFGPGPDGRAELSRSGSLVLRANIACSPCNYDCLYSRPVCMASIELANVQAALGNKLAALGFVAVQRQAR